MMMMMMVVVETMAQPVELLLGKHNKYSETHDKEHQNQDMCYKSYHIHPQHKELGESLTDL